MVTHVMPVGNASFGEARQTGEMRAVYLAGEASFSSVRSLLKVVGFQYGCVMACRARKDHVGWGEHRSPELMGTEGAGPGEALILHPQSPPVLLTLPSQVCNPGTHPRDGHNLQRLRVG